VSRGALAARALFVAFAVLTSAYGLVAYDPFTFEQVIRFELFPGVAWFARAHAGLAALAQLAAAASIAGPLRAGRARWLARAYLATAAVGAAALLARPVLAGLGNEPRALWVGLLALVPVAWLAAVDVVDAGPRARAAAAPGDAGRAALRAGLGAGMLVFAAFSLVAATRGARPSPALGYACALHALLAVAVAAALLLAAAPPRAAAQLGAGTLLVAAVLAAGLRKVLAVIAFPAGLAPAVAAAGGAALALSLLGVALRARGGEGLPPLARLARPLALPGRWPWAIRAGAPLAACVAVAVLSARYDYQFLQQEGAAFAAWLLVVAALLSAPDRRTDPPRAPALAALAAAAAVLALGARALAAAPEAPAQVAAAIARDPSLRLLAPGAAATAPADFFAFLGRHTNLGPEVAIAPLDVRLAGGPLRATPGRKPDVFVFVVDSLRRDYLPPYAPAAAAFAPNVAAFARDAVAFENAFTRYGATGLSEPSIWVGGMLPHKQYVTPFAPMNALDKLLVAEGYRQHVSVDTILDVVLPPSAERVRLDADVANKDYALCRTLSELRARLEAEDRARPVFAYTQPQDQHLSRITREGARPVGEGAIPAGFHPPVASRVRRWDACFGEFLRWLDASGRGDQSVVALTADHGDSIGEEGRWGHAYTLYPEVVRVPLLVRFPRAWRDRVRCRPAELAFTADLTPTLYALLGHPVAERPPFGAPLCSLDAEPPPRHEGPQLIASSYGPVYGLVEDGGARLFVADAIANVEEAFALAGGAPGRVAVGAEERAIAERTIVAKIRELEAAYDLHLP
jgi:sulfatase-like protein